MKVLFRVGHPSHVHFFKNVIWNLKSKGHETKIAATDKENVLYLLNAYGLEYEIVGRERLGLARKLINMFNQDYKIYKLAKDFKPDILVGESSMTMAQVSKLVKKPSIIFDDTEHAIEHYLLFAPFADVICTPSCYKRKVNYNTEVMSNFKTLVEYSLIATFVQYPGASIISFNFKTLVEYFLIATLVKTLF